MKNIYTYIIEKQRNEKGQNTKHKAKCNAHSRDGGWWQGVWQANRLLGGLVVSVKMRCSHVWQRRIYNTNDNKQNNNNTNNNIGNVAQTKTLQSFKCYKRYKNL